MKFSLFDSLIENRKSSKFQPHSPSGSDFTVILDIFHSRFDDEMWFRAFSGYPQKFRKLNKSIGFIRMGTLPGKLSEKLNFKFVINPKMDFSGGKKA